MVRRAVLIGLDVPSRRLPPSGLRSRASCLALRDASPRFSIAALRLAGIADFHRLDQRRQGGFGIGRHLHVDDLEALKVLVVGFGE